MIQVWVFYLDSFRFDLYQIHLRCTGSNGSNESRKKNVNKEGTSIRERLWLNFEVHREDSRFFLMWYEILCLCLYFSPIIFYCSKNLSRSLFSFNFLISFFFFVQTLMLCYSLELFQGPMKYLQFTIQILSVLAPFHNLHNSKAETKQHFGKTSTSLIVFAMFIFNCYSY